MRLRRLIRYIHKWLNTSAAFQNVSCLVFEQNIVLHNATVKRRQRVLLTQLKNNQALDL